jgi:hypothetical protein
MKDRFFDLIKWLIVLAATGFTIYSLYPRYDFFPYTGSERFIELDRPVSPILADVYNSPLFRCDKFTGEVEYYRLNDNRWYTVGKKKRDIF